MSAMLLWRWCSVAATALLFGMVYTALPNNRALNKPAWTHYTPVPGDQAVDGDPSTPVSFISFGEWLFLGVDMESKYDVFTVALTISFMGGTHASLVVQIAVGDSRLERLNASVVAQLSICSSVNAAMVASTGEYQECQCQRGISGRYLYVYREQATDMQMKEVEVFGCPQEQAGEGADAQSFIVPLRCRDDLARTPDLPACGEVDINQMRPPCELRQPRDAQTLLQAGAISGSLDLPYDATRPYPVICSALSQEMYYCVERMTGDVEGVAFSINCPFKNLTIEKCDPPY